MSRRFFALALTCAVALSACDFNEFAAKGIQSRGGPLSGDALAARRAEMVRMASAGQTITLPDNAPALDAAEAAHDYRNVRQLMAESGRPELVLNWSKIAIFRGAGFGIAQFYATDLWQMATVYEQAVDMSAQSTEVRDAVKNLKLMAGINALYTLAAIQEDGLRCADPAASKKHLDDAYHSLAPMLNFVRELPTVEKDEAIAKAMGLATRTAEIRARDRWLCQSEAIESKAMTDAVASYQGAEAAGDNSLPGREVQVVLDPAILFVDDGVWWRQIKSERPRVEQSLRNAVVSR